MEGQPAKRRRVYSLEPNKVVQSMFSRNYVNYLVPALMKIKEKSSTSSAEEDCGKCDLKNVVKYEVDMALAFSAQGFAWSHGLKAKLQREHHHAMKNNAAATTTDTTGEGSSLIQNLDEMVPKNMIESMMNKDFGSREEDDDDEEMMMMKSQLRNLRRLIPGGEEMCDDEKMVTELESYINCLQMQVNVLQCLLADDTP